MRILRKLMAVTSYYCVSNSELLQPFNNHYGCTRMYETENKKNSPDIQELAWFCGPGLGVAGSWHRHAQLGLLNINYFAEQYRTRPLYGYYGYKQQ